METLLQIADLNIIEHDIHTKTDMNTEDRVAPHTIMSYIKKGRAVLRVGNQEYEHPAGSLALIPAYLKHTHFKRTGEETVFLWWHFNFTVAEVVDVLRFLNLPLIYSLKAPGNFEEIFLRYWDIHEAERTLPNLLRRKAVAIEVLAQLFEELITYSVPGNEQKADVFMGIFTDIVSHTGSILTLNELSEKYGLHPTYLSNRFKKHFGIGPIHMQREIMLERSKKLLRSTNIAVGDIALSVGYSDIFTFSHIFTEKVGMCPSQYRKTV